MGSITAPARTDLDLIQEFISELQASQTIGLVRTNKIIYAFITGRR